MTVPGSLALTTDTPIRVLDGFGGAVRAACRFVQPASVEELADWLAVARRQRVTVAFRGSGRSYGDAALNTSGIVIDLSRIRRVFDWNPRAGVIDTEPGLTIEGLWRRTLADGYWPSVVPGTMHPTLGGCVGMNIHGKNNYRAGPFGEHVREIDLLTVTGDLITCGPDRSPEIFHAAVGGMGLLGAITRVVLELSPVETGLLDVEPLRAASLDALFDLFEQSLAASDYTVGWVDCTARGASLGRGVIHRARYVPAADVADPAQTLNIESQGLPSTILGVPKSQLWRVMQFGMSPGGVRLVNAAKYHSAAREHGRHYRQSHVAFAFLLDYVPDWRLAYGNAGFIQHQIFLPHTTARATLAAVLELCQQRGIPSYLGVLKRHRPDAFVLSHALDGWSFAMDFPVSPHGREKLWALTHEVTERVLTAGGRFYFAKDAVLRPADVERAYGRARLDQFLAIKARLDPDDLLTTDLWRRVRPSSASAAPPPSPSHPPDNVSMGARA